MLSLLEIRNRIEYLADKLSTDELRLPTYGYSQDSGRPHIEVDNRGYHFVVKERGNELERMTTSDIDILLYRLFKSVTFALASDYELTHRIEGQDNRRIIFKKWAGLMGSISPDWKKRCEEEINSILFEHPYS